MRAQAWTAAEVRQLLCVATRLRPYDVDAAEFWQAADLFVVTEHAIERKRLQRQVTKIFPRVAPLEVAAVQKPRARTARRRAT